MRSRRIAWPEGRAQGTGSVRHRPSVADNRGFSLMELLVVALIISIVMAIALPNLRQAVLKARATSVVGELNTVKVAIQNYQAEYLTWPPDVSRGVIPEGLAPFLPENIGFCRKMT